MGLFCWVMALPSSLPLGLSSEVLAVLFAFFFLGATVPGPYGVVRRVLRLVLLPSELLLLGYLFVSLLVFLAMQSELPLLITFFPFLDHDWVDVAHCEVETGKVLRLFCQINLDIVRALPSASLCIVWAGES